VAALLERARRAGWTPGGAAGWIEAGRRDPVVVAVGRAAVAPSPVDATPATWFDLASLTKPLVVGCLSLLAIRWGWFGLATTVGDVLPEAAGRPISAATIGQLLTHTSGLPAWSPIYALTEGRPERALDAVVDLPMVDPGTRVVYSCPGFLLLGWMLERRGGAALDALFADHVLRPLGLSDELGFRPGPDRPVAAGASAPDAERTLVRDCGLDPAWVPQVGRGLPDDGNARFLGGVAGNAGLFGSAAGVLGLARIYIERDGLLRGGEIDAASANRTTGREQARGLGWQLAGSPGCSAGPSLDRASFGHTGFTGTSLWIDPTRGAAMALLANRVHPGHRSTDLHPLRRRFHRLVVDAVS
jgi:CubicO group peptidase (beta-lactamase class C family)